MTREEMIRTVLGIYFQGFKDNLIDAAAKQVCDIMKESEPKYMCNADGSVEPVQKTGFWLYSLSRKPFKCSECGNWSYADWDYCPHCGAKMEGVREREEVLHERS